MSNAGGSGISTEQLKARYVGTGRFFMSDSFLFYFTASPYSILLNQFFSPLAGHADMSKYEWLTNQHRDTYASHVGHYDQLSYYAVAQNESIGRLRLQFLENMIAPCGPYVKKMLESLIYYIILIC